MSAKISPYLLLCLTNLFWSLNFIIGKLLAGVIPTSTLSFLRWLPPFFFFLLLYWRDLQEHRQFFKKHIVMILVLGATGYSLNSICVYEAVRFTTTINTSFINAFNPVLIAVAGLLMYRYPITRRQGLGFLLSLVGVLFIIFKGKMSRILDLQVNIGDLFMVGSISSWAIHTIVYKRKASQLPGRAIFPLMMLAGLVVTFPLALNECLTDNWGWISQVHARHLMGILALNIFPSVLAYMFWNQALSSIPANQVAIFQYLIPVYTTLISVTFLGEHLQAFHLAGGGLIFFGVLLVTNTRLSTHSLLKKIVGIMQTTRL
jgi:drug/metabolite transporter (DMT)-like permease